MTELEKIERAKMYMDKLANGINPIDDTVVSEKDIINNVRLSRCFFFVSDVLRQVIEHGGLTSSATTKKPEKLPFSLPYEKRNCFAFSEDPIPASEIAKRLNALIDDKAMKKTSYKTITSWLFEIGALAPAALPSGKQTKHPTPDGVKLGITVEERTGSQGPYQVVVYDIQAQHFILDNLDVMVEAAQAATEMRGKPWSQEQDDCLRTLYLKEVPLHEIAITLKRNTGAIRARLRKLGLV
nr:hypothetical protein [uncultured Oscillibacter sp.]